MTTILLLMVHSTQMQAVGEFTTVRNWWRFGSTMKSVSYLLLFAAIIIGLYGDR